MHIVLIPGWIMTFGVVALCAAPMGVAASLALFVVGVFVVPALALMLPAVRLRAGLAIVRP